MLACTISKAPSTPNIHCAALALSERQGSHDVLSRVYLFLDLPEALALLAFTSSANPYLESSFVPPVSGKADPRRRDGGPVGSQPWTRGLASCPCLLSSSSSSLASYSRGRTGRGYSLDKGMGLFGGGLWVAVPPPRGGSPARFRRAGSTGRTGGPAGLRFPPVPSAGQVRAWGNKGKCEASLCRCLGDRRVAFVSVLEMAEGQGGRIGAAFLRKNRCPMGKVTWCPQEPQHPINCLFCLPAVASKEDRDGGQGAARIPEGDLWALAGSCVEKGQPYSVFSVTRAYSLLILFQSDPRLGVTVL